MTYPGDGGFKADGGRNSNSKDGCSCSLISNSCCFCASLQTGTTLIGLVGILASIVFIALHIINGTYVSVILIACAVIILSVLVIAGAVLERPVLLIGYIVVVGVGLLLFCGYFIYYIYFLMVSTISIAAYIPILVFLFLGKLT